MSLAISPFCFTIDRQVGVLRLICLGKACWPNWRNITGPVHFFKYRVAGALPEIYTYCADCCYTEPHSELAEFKFLIALDSEAVAAIYLLTGRLDFDALCGTTP